MRTVTGAPCPLPTASTAEIRRGYDAKVGLLRPELLAGGPAAVVLAAWRAQEILDTAVNRSRGERIGPSLT